MCADLEMNCQPAVQVEGVHPMNNNTSVVRAVNSAQSMTHTHTQTHSVATGPNAWAVLCVVAWYTSYSNCVPITGNTILSSALIRFLGG